MEEELKFLLCSRWGELQEEVMILKCLEDKNYDISGLINRIKQKIHFIGGVMEYNSKGIEELNVINQVIEQGKVREQWLEIEKLMNSTNTKL
ncbi:hypothetical protein ES705_43263 [subsurface metagenome]